MPDVRITHVEQRTAPAPTSHTKRDYEERALAMSVIMLIIGILTIFGSIAFAAWTYSNTPDDWDQSDDVGRMVVAIIVSAIYLLIILLAVVVGAIIIAWFSLWTSGKASDTQRTLYTLMLIGFVFMAILYFVNFLLGIALFVLDLVEEESVAIGFWGTLCGFIFVILFIMLTLAARKVCKVRSYGE
uniref:Uncharacterized protein n=1 Tax=Percolomonas cosmopolitus TaxID=63605 RepID=A0A7S1KLP2_9EUKA|mmetsp:Transcript_10167/g.37834  ORF Transcript_10167/g.37834 Transcript_10167/m.37834 type:complete len:186 (+) Transcript_10167:501-1058(+)